MTTNKFLDLKEIKVEYFKTMNVFIPFDKMLSKFVTYSCTTNTFGSYLHDYHHSFHENHYYR